MKKFSIAALLFGAYTSSPNAFAADPAALPPPPATPSASAPIVEFLSYSSATTRRSWDNYVEGTVAIAGNLDESGFRGRLGLGFGRYDYPVRGEDADVPWSDFGLPWIREIGKISGRYYEGSFLLGYELVTDRYSLLGLIGGEGQRHSLSQWDPENQVKGTKWGFKVVAQIDSHPFDKTMFFAYGSYSTAFQTAHVDVRPGYLAFDRLNIGDLVSIGNVYVGPHGVYDSDLHDRIWKAGAHLTIPELGPFHTTLAGGYVHDRFNKSGAYGLVETSVRF